MYGRDHSEDKGLGGRIILERILGKESVEGVSWMHLAQDKDQWWALCEHSNELSGSIKGREFLD